MHIFFKAMKDPTRREILNLLRDGDLSAGEIARNFNMSKPSISHHLDLLKQAGLITGAKKGQFIYYSLDTTVIDETIKWLMQFKQNKKIKKTP
ncbi:MAG: autorepressor SdpR family transcription factor [Flavobacteriales bacterium]